MEIPPSFNKGVTSSARYNQIWGISMAMSSANSKVSEKLKKEQEKKNHWKCNLKVKITPRPKPVKYEFVDAKPILCEGTGQLQRDAKMGAMLWSSR